MRKILSRFIGIILAICAMLLFVFSTCAISFRISATNVDTYKETLVNQNVYEDIIPYVIPAILEDNQLPLDFGTDFSIDHNDMDKFLTENDWREIAHELLPAEWLQTQIETILDRIFMLTQGDFSQVNQPADLDEVITRLRGEEARNVAGIIISAAPECTATQIRQLDNFKLGDNQTFPICKPTDSLYEKSTSILSTWFANIANRIEASLEQTPQEVIYQENLARFVYQLAQFDSQISLLFYLCPMALLTLIVIVAVRSLKSFGRWMGWSAILTGIIIVFLLFALQYLVFDAFDSVLRATTNIERFQAQLFAGLIRSLYDSMSNIMLIHIGVFIALGFVLLAVSSIAPSPDIAVPRGSVLITDDGRIISTSQSKRNPKKTAD